MKRKKIFVTGGTGFLGSYLLRMLVKQGETELYALKRSSSSFALVESVKDKVHWLEGDLLDINFLGDVIPEMDLIYHCAAFVSFDPKDRVRMYETNIVGTANLVNIALSEGIEKMLHVSSTAALGRDKKKNHINEQSDWQQSSLNSAYAISKYESEMEVWRGIAEGLKAVIVNPSIILGSGFWDLGSAKLFKQVAGGLSFYPRGTNGFVDVRDLSQVMIRLMESDIERERFIVSADNYLYQDVLSNIARSMNKKAPSREIGSFLRELSWRLAWLGNKFSTKKSLIHKETLRNSYHHFYYDNQKIKTAIDFNFRPLEETIAATSAQYKAEEDFAFLAL